ncbi:DUF6225 family protein [Streptomyces sp. NPDC056255]|uniref:DUF6225 family protein n=1 Tax=Streptomyces sp. NPDC056255 TaxID=3345764 RepID=UPI0035D64F34
MGGCVVDVAVSWGRSALRRGCLLSGPGPAAGWSISLEPGLYAGTGIALLAPPEPVSPRVRRRVVGPGPVQTVVGARLPVGEQRQCLRLFEHTPQVWNAARLCDALENLPEDVPIHIGVTGDIRGVGSGWVVLLLQVS